METFSRIAVSKRFTSLITKMCVSYTFNTTIINYGHFLLPFRFQLISIFYENLTEIIRLFYNKLSSFGSFGENIVYR